MSLLLLPGPREVRVASNAGHECGVNEYLEGSETGPGAASCGHNHATAARHLHAGHVSPLAVTRDTAHGARVRASPADTRLSNPTTAQLDWALLFK
ncbi:hypothetical protein RRG08_067075 [Elysia crispata]|uniref:Uncharacterized protein n=1 Tax=Elysia crispata TaxID=231223 RepID=A0AAE1EBV4_9GAST|nr:hypothetical protein RRG08_067075 [Elysia crispata]